MRYCNRDCWILACLTLIFCQSPSEGALQVEGYTTALHDRFANDGSFIAASYNLSGIGINSSGRWGTLISPNLILSAYHFRPAIGSDMVFHADNDPNGASLSRRVIAGQRIGGSDLWIGVLKSSLSAGYLPFPMTFETIANNTEFFNASLNDQEAFMVGRSPRGFPTTEDVAFGKNILNDWANAVQPTGQDTIDRAIIAYEDLAGDTDFIPIHEAYLQTGDSGAPLLRDVAGILTLVGLNWFIGAVDLNPSPMVEDLRNISGFSYIGNYAADLQPIISAFAVDATEGYVSWMTTAFGGETDWALIGPAIDFDQDGLINFMEYAFNLDPTSGAELNPGISAVVENAGTHYLQLSFFAKDDSGLIYRLRLGSDLTSYLTVPLLFDGINWSSSDPAKVLVEQQSDLGSGLWSLSIRDQTGLLPGGKHFLLVSVN